MATPGDPFKTDELDQLRARQRRRLRVLPDDIVRVATEQARLPGQLGDVHPVTEWGLRRLASEYEGRLGDYPDRCERWRAGSSALEALATVTNVGGNRSAFWQLLHEVQHGAAPRPTIGSVGNDAGAFIVLAALADLAAGDGYRDPRLGATGRRGS